MALCNMPQFMGHHGSKFCLGACGCHEARKDGEPPSRARKRIDQPALNEKKPQPRRIPFKTRGKPVAKRFHVANQQRVFNESQLLAGCCDELAAHGLFLGRNDDSSLQRPQGLTRLRHSRHCQDPKRHRKGSAKKPPAIS